MTTLDDQSPPVVTVELPLRLAGPIVRGLRWGDGPNWVILLHDEGDDLDAWGRFPAALAAAGYAVLALDLPGHGLSDGEWSPAAAADLLAAASRHAKNAGADRVFAVLAGGATPVSPPPVDLALDAAAVLSPPPPRDDALGLAALPIPKLLMVGSADRGAAATADAFFRVSRGWTALSAFGVADQGARLLHGAWGERVREQITAFFADYRRPPGAGGLHS